MFAPHAIATMSRINPFWERVVQTSTDAGMPVLLKIIQVLQAEKISVKKDPTGLSCGIRISFKPISQNMENPHASVAADV
jgi:hypothetical protein